MDKSDNIIYGRNPVKESLRAHKVINIWANESFKDEEIISLAKKENVQIKYISNIDIDKMAEGCSAQGVIAKVKPFEYASFDNILSICKKQINPILVILDGIEDPHNMGAIVRSADIFGVSAVIIPKHNQVPINSTVAKSSAGAINYVPIALVGNLNQTLEILKREGFWVVVTDGEGNIDYSSIKYDFPVALVIGSEGRGVSKLIKQNADYLVKIPMYGKVNSLNASVAAGILLSRIKS